MWQGYYIAITLSFFVLEHLSAKCYNKRLMKLKINLQTLNRLTIIYAALPLLIFLFGWLKPYIAIISCCLLIYAVYAGYFKNFKYSNLLDNRKIFWLMIAAAFLWCWLAGLGGFWYQSDDHHYRNAIFRDLINYVWPVYYKTADASMVYYIGYWLPSALLAKIFANYSDYFSFFIGNIFLLLYSIFGVFLVFCHLIKAVKAKSFYKILTALIIFIFFSGMDAVGASYPVFYDASRTFKTLHLEWWSCFVGQYSSMTTVLFWVFNQGIPAWLMTVMFYNNRKDIKNFGLAAILCFFLAPMPFVGLSVFMFAYVIRNFFLEYKRKNISLYFRKIFSVQNIFSVFFITPIIFLYFTSNGSVQGTENISGIPNIYLRFYIIMFVYFFLLEAGINLLFIYGQYKATVLYYVCFAVLLICPLIKIGGGADFCMRGSIPALVLLCIMITKFLFRKYNCKYRKVCYSFLILCLFLGSVTPAIEFIRGIKDVVEHKEIFRTADYIKTLEGKVGYDENGNLMNANFATDFTDKNFFKYLAKPKE